MGAPKNFYNVVDQAKLGINQIPDVTAADNGDVLTVIEGKWGKGSSKINKTTLYTGDTLANTITLSNGMSNYSALLITYKASQPTTHQPVLDSRIYDVDDLIIGVSLSKYDNASNYISYTVSNDDEFTLADQAGSNWMVSRIVGIK